MCLSLYSPQKQLNPFTKLIHTGDPEPIVRKSNFFAKRIELRKLLKP
tara:strand:- start:205 stop:345 length:141 start_codon:yes stop_codon:yes gene_type:complete